MNHLRPSSRRARTPVSLAAVASVALLLAACNEDGPDAALGAGSASEEASDEAAEPTEDAATAEEAAEPMEDAEADAEAAAEASGDEVDGDPAPEPDSADDAAGDETASDGAESDEAADDMSSTDSGAAVDTVPPNGEVVTVLSLDNTFIEEEIEVEAGTEVLWTNNGRNDHNILPVDPTQDWGVEVEDFKPGDEYSYVFGAPGEYPYFCSIHGTETVGMVGTVVVTG